VAISQRSVQLETDRQASLGRGCRRSESAARRGSTVRSVTRRRVESGGMLLVRGDRLACLVVAVGGQSGSCWAARASSGVRVTIRNTGVSL